MQFPHQPMTLTRRAQPFSHPDWLFEIKHDGFRALAYLKEGRCKLVSRKGYVYKRFGELTEHIGASVNVQSAVLDGEIVCLDKSGKSQFKSLMYRVRERTSTPSTSFNWTAGIAVLSATRTQAGIEVRRIRGRSTC
jgi:bifunctional non-homologous end joining protein LigD